VGLVASRVGIQSHQSLYTTNVLRPQQVASLTRLAAPVSSFGEAHAEPEFVQVTALREKADTLLAGFGSAAGPAAFLASAATAGFALAAGLVALYQRVCASAASGERVALAAVAGLEAPQDTKTKPAPPAHLPPLAGDAPFRPDLFQPVGEPGTIALSDIPYVQKRRWWSKRSFNATDIVFFVTVAGIHAAAFILGPMTYRPDCLALALVMYVVTGLFGITLSFHRQLSHRSFTTPKWLEYLFAYCGVLAIQGDPLEWVSSHRYHHLYTETDRDPHTINEGLWWSHMGWLLDHEATKSRTEDQTNAPDIANDPFYSFIKKTYPLHPLLFACAMYAWGGLPYLVWGVAVRTVWVWHITWFVNSASHAWGDKTYQTNPPDESRNNWWVGLLAFGEGWHNNHHAFQFSARHGLEWWQIDMTYYVVRALQFVGLASNVKLPTEARKNAMRLA